MIMKRLNLIILAVATALTTMAIVPGEAMAYHNRGGYGYGHGGWGPGPGWGGYGSGCGGWRHHHHHGRRW
jgi:hypothetical protein